MNKPRSPGKIDYESLRAILAVLGVVAVVWLATRISSLFSESSQDQEPFMEYQGQQFKLSKAYEDYDDYKNDTANLAPGEIERVQKFVASAPIAKQFADSRKLDSAVGQLKFPGYGMGSYAEQPQPDGSALKLFDIEIPQSGNNRYLLFHGQDGSYTLIDDFVHSEREPISRVSVDGNRLFYTNTAGKPVVERTPSVR